jgi:integrase
MESAMTIRDQLYAVALERGLRQSTLYGYERLFRRLGILDLDSITHEDAMQRLWTIESTNTRRSAVIALRSVLGMKIKIPKQVPRRYDLPDEDTLRLALMTSPHEVRGLLMMYGGLRVGEACAITLKDVAGDRLNVDKQVLQLMSTGKPTVTRLAPVKSFEAAITIPHFVAEAVMTLNETVLPAAVRESLRRAGWRVGVQINPHMLRHWYATTMLARGVSLSLVSRQMRHSDIATTLRTYSQDNPGTIHDVFKSKDN